MNSHTRWLVAAAILVAWNCGGAALAPQSATPPEPSGGHPFTHEETLAFFAAVQRAEAIVDPVQRCLAYPDPPGSHWSHVAVEAYCRNQLGTGLTFKSLSERIGSGQGHAVDRRLSRLLHNQLSRHGVPGVLDATYETDFDNASAETRSVLDAWKHQSPHSAYAFAASGVAYVAAAQEARGAAWADDTPQSKLDAMDTLLADARHDLDRAITLNRRMIPAYAAMIKLAGLSGDDAYAQAAAERALKADSSDYLIYSRLIWMSQPKWGGSVDAMRSVIAKAQKHVKRNPLLIMLQNQADAVAAGLDDCGCNSSLVDVALYRRVFDQAVAKSWLGGAGMSAQKAGQDTLAVIYLSEALRFTPVCGCSTDYLVSRSNALTMLGQHAWAVTDADRAIKIDPTKKRAWTARGYAYRVAHDYKHAEADDRVALKLEPGDPWTLDELGRIYVYSTHEYDQGWDVANQMIHNHPEDPDGWIFRASIQKDQPRSGLQDTVRYFIAHFGNDPQQRPVVAQMRPYLTQQP
jgi:tetratricopeptide (TPR) repeat protein